jgi:branched-chain amino acid aminotransferase
MYYKENTMLYLDGRWQKASESHAGLYDQTLHYGYGVFEGIRSYTTQDGPRIFRARDHYERLRRSCESIGIPFTYDVEELEAVTYQLLEKNGFKDAYIRPLVFCGPNMSLTSPTEVHILICAWEWAAYLGQRNLKLKISGFCRPHPKSIHVEAKACGHYVNSILATTEAKKDGYDEALLLDYQGFLAEGPGANLFFGKGMTLFTPAKGSILPGITRDTIFKLCREMGITVKEGNYLPSELRGADYAFYCGTAAEVAGIESVDGHLFALPWISSSGKKIQEAYTALVHEKTIHHVFPIAGKV